MSGGSYNYFYGHMQDAAAELRSRHPYDPTVAALATHLDALANVMHGIEWADSGDRSWNEELRQKIRDALPVGGELRAAIALAEQARTALDQSIAVARGMGGVGENA